MKDVEAKKDVLDRVDAILKEVEARSNEGELEGDPVKDVLAKVEALLVDLEFCVSEGDHCSVCPSCRECAHKHARYVNGKEVDRRGHGEDCKLAAVLKLVREKKETV
jgi:hypothetical protein